MAGSGSVVGGLEYQFEAYIASASAPSPPQLSFEYSTDNGVTWTAIAVAGLSTADGVW